jgi:FkbM family methyltransferase
LGFPTVAVEPVIQHVETIQGTIDLNPSFNMELHHNGVSYVERSIHANFGHGSRNWGASEFHEANQNEAFELELKLKTVDHLMGNRHVALMKIDCEGCEWEALKGWVCLSFFLQRF